MLGFRKSDGDGDRETGPRQPDELEILEDIAAQTASDQPLQQTIDNITTLCIKRFKVEEGVIHLFEQAQPSDRWKTIVRQAGTRFGGQAFRPTDQLIGWVLKHRRPLLINNAEESPVPNLMSDGIRSLLSAPLQFQGNLIGVLNLINSKTDGGFTEGDERVLPVIAAQAAHVIYTAHLIGDLRESRTALEEENSALLERLRGELKTQIIGSSPSLTQIMRVIERIRNTNVDVLVTGESGTGKELIAKAVHESSPRSAGRFVALNCAALPETLLESELFGIEKGVATGVDRRAGQFEMADGGTLFLDEIGELGLAGQAKILRALQERVIQRVGGREPIPIDVRIVVATNRDLEEQVKKGEFREDLYYRLKVIHLHVPALRERREDIPQLISYFAETYSQEFQRPPVRFASDALAALSSRDWPGNVRELQNELKRLVICSSGPLIRLKDLTDDLSLMTAGDEQKGSDEARTIEESVAEFEKRLLIEALQVHSGNQTQTAKALGVSRPGLYKKLRRYGIRAAAEPETP